MLSPRLRPNSHEIPPSWKTPEAHECLALDGGAIDFICRSRGMEVLARRLKRAVEATKPADRPRSDNGIVTSPGKLRSLWLPGSQRDDENQLRRLPIPTTRLRHGPCLDVS
jgi:hypothetical protein